MTRTRKNDKNDEYANDELISEQGLMIYDFRARINACLPYQAGFTKFCKKGDGRKLRDLGEIKADGVSSYNILIPLTF